MASLTLKVILAKSSQSKTLRFRANMTVAEAARLIAQGVNDGSTPGECGLYQPTTARNKARWLRMERTLEFYELRNDDTLEYKKRMRPLKVKLEDGTVKTVLIDDSDTVAQVVETIGKKMNLKGWEEFTLKFDDKDQWLTSGQSLTEQGLTEKDAVQLKKRFFVNDVNIDRTDPVQLHLVYAQSKNSVLAGDHPLTPEEAANLGALECQIVHGDFNPSVHRPGFVDAPKFLPPNYHDKKNDVEKLLIAEYKKLVGMTEINAKFRYVSDVRKLKTYGITSFEVQQKEEGKKKPVLKRLGVTRDAILILDGETREILREFPLTHLRRWAAAPKNFTLDFGDYQDDYFSFLTDDGEAISQLIGGYIDILLKKRKDAARVLEDDTALRATIGEVDGARGAMTKGMAAQRGKVGVGGQGAGSGVGGGEMPLEYVSGPFGQQIKVTDLAQANRAMLKMLDDAANNPYDVSMLNAAARSNEEWRQQMMLESNAAKQQSGELMKALENPNGADASLLNACASKMGQHIGALLNCARLAAAGADGDPALLDAARLLAEMVAKMLKNANELNENPDSEQARLLYASAREEFEATQAMLNACCQGKLTDEADQRLLLAQAKAVAAATADLLRLTEAASASLPESAKKALLAKGVRADELGGHMLGATRVLAPTIVDADCQAQLLNVSKNVKGGTGALLAAAKAANIGGDDYKGLLEGAKSVSDAITALMKAAEAAEARPTADAQLQSAVNRMANAAAGLGDASGKPREIMERTKLLALVQSRLMALAKAHVQSLPDELRGAMLDAAKSLAAATQALVDAAKNAAKAPNDADAQAALRAAAAEVESRAVHLGKLGNRGGQLQLLRANAKYAAAATTELRAAVQPSRARTGDSQADNALLAAAKASADAMSKLLAVVYASRPNDPAAFATLCQQAQASVGEAFPLVAAAKRAVPNIRDVNAKQQVQLTANEAQGAIKRLMDATKQEKAAGAEDFDDAFTMLSDDAAELEQAHVAAQQRTLRSTGQSKEDAMAALQTGARQLGQASMDAAKAANDLSQLGPKNKAAAETSSQVARAARSLAAALGDGQQDLQLKLGVLERAKALNAASLDMLAAAQTVAEDVSQQAAKVALAQAAKANAAAVAELVRFAKATEQNGVDVALLELDKAMKELNPRPAAAGGDFKTPAAQLVQAANAVDAAATSLASAGVDRRAQDAGGRQVAAKLPLLIAAANAAAASAPDAATRQTIVAQTRQALQQLGVVLQGAKKGDANAMDTTALSTTLVELAAACDVLTPEERAVADALRAYSDAAQRVGGASATRGATNYAAATAQLSATTKALLTAMSKLQAASKSNVKDMPAAFSAVAQSMPAFVDAHANAMAAAPPDVKRELTNAAKQIADNGGAFLQQAKEVYDQPKNVSAHQALANEYKNTATAVRTLVGAIDKGATGAKATEDAVALIERLQQELTTGVFDAVKGDVFEDELVATAQAAAPAADAARAFAALPVGDQAGMQDAAAQAAQAASELGERAKRAARTADPDDKLTTQQLVERTKALLAALRETLRAGQAYQANAANQRAADAMRASAASAVKAAQALDAMATAAAGGGTSDAERALSDAQGRLRQLVQQYKQGAFNSAPAPAEGTETDEVVGVARQVAAEAAGIAAAQDPAQLRDASQSCVLSAEQLLQRTAACLSTAVDPKQRARLQAASGNAVEALVALCEAGKGRARKANAATQKEVNDAAANVAAKVNDVVSSAQDALPKKASSIDSGENLEELAADELANCAREIERAAALLMAKPARVRTAGLDAFDQVTDAILDAAKNIANATAQLVVVATKAQKEISAASGGASKKENVYKSDPAWAKGLISAAQAVAGNVKLLVNAANKAARGEGSEEELVACGRGVAAATIRLVTAARAKADPFSPTQRELAAAAKQVQVATDDLVAHAKTYSEVTETDKGPDIDAMSGVQRTKFVREQENQLADLEAQLRKEQEALLKMQKARYQK